MAFCQCSPSKAFIQCSELCKVLGGRTCYIVPGCTLSVELLRAEVYKRLMNDNKVLPGQQDKIQNQNYAN